MKSDTFDQAITRFQKHKRDGKVQLSFADVAYVMLKYNVSASYVINKPLTPAHLEILRRFDKNSQKK